MDNYSLADIAAASGNEGLGGANAWVLILLFAMIFGNGGFGFGNRTGELGQYATAASQQEILFGQRFDSLGQKINQIGDGICSSTYALNSSIKDGNAAVSGAVVNEGRAIQTQLAQCCCENQRNVDSVRYDMAQGFANANATTTAATQRILDALAQNKIDALQAQVSELKTQNMFCGIPRINPYGYGVYPYSTGCGCQSL